MLYGMLTSAVSSKASSASEHWHMGGGGNQCLLQLCICYTEGTHSWSHAYNTSN